jgi:WD40 repeat protein
METQEKSTAKQIVRAPAQALAVRSAALVTRGLRDLARDSNWLIKKVFTGRSSQLVISPAGEVCALSPMVRQGTERIALYDIERGVPTLALVVPGEPDVCPPGLSAAFTWSPTARHLVAAWGGWLPELHVFDLHGKVFLGGFGDFESFPSCVTWSDTGNYLAAASRGGGEARLRLWPASKQSPSAMPFAADPVAELGAPTSGQNWLEPKTREPQTADAEPGDEGVFSGFGRTAFSPDEGTLASVVEIEGEWADDSIILLDVPTLRRLQVIPAQGHITDTAWTPDSSQLIYCSAGQAYRAAGQSTEPEALPFGAELCACHPRLPICLCFSSWLKNSAKGRLFLVDLNRLEVFDEYAAEGVVNIRWSLDGSKAYAVTADGLAYIYDPPLL